MPSPEDQLPDTVQKWVIDSVDSAAMVLATRRLHGGMSSLVHEVALQIGSTTERYVLRQFDNASWLADEPDLARHEAEVLRLVATVDVRTPGIVAFDETGDACGLPAVLMTLLDGVVVLNPRSEAVWLDGLAASLAKVHTLSADDFPWKYFAYTDVASLKTPTWSRFPEQWEAAIRIVRDTRPAFRPCFIHRDYHPTNVLWDGGSVSGIVDWVNGCEGPAGIDVGHCRSNLVQLHGVPTADAFLTAYGRHAGTAFEYDSYWDLVTLMDLLSGEPPAVY
jgi:aminoglycoside phosphotransferase (APT) family kinase protein